jgi:hypothetical protein
MKRPHALWGAAPLAVVLFDRGRPPPAPPIRAITGPIASTPGNASLAPVATRSTTPQTVPGRSRTTRTMNSASRATCYHSELLVSVDRHLVPPPSPTGKPAIRRRVPAPADDSLEREDLLRPNAAPRAPNGQLPPAAPARGRRHRAAGFVEPDRGDHGRLARHRGRAPLPENRSPPQLDQRGRRTGPDARRRESLKSSPVLGRVPHELDPRLAPGDLQLDRVDAAGAGLPVRGHDVATRVAACESPAPGVGRSGMMGPSRAILVLFRS